MTAQRVAFDAWSTSLSREELLRRVARMQEIVASYGVDLLQDPGAQVAIMAVQGNVEDAIELALSDIFAATVLMHQGWRARYSQAQYAELTADPRIRTAMQKWETEEAVVRDKVRNYLLDLSSAS